MSDKAHKEGTCCILRGLFCLAVGSVLLLVCKFSGVPELLGNLSAFVGGCVVLYGNGYIVYGLFIFVDDSGSMERRRAEDPRL